MGYDGTLKFDTSIDTTNFQSGIDKISSIAGAGIKATTAILAGAATAVIGIGTAAIKVGSDFESGMSKVAAISGASGQELESLTDKAKEMGAKTKFSATESAAAMEYMAMAGWKTGDMLNGIEGIMNLAAASGEDLATTSDIVTDALTAFGMSAQDSTHFADVLAAASSNANTNVGLMGQTFKYVAPVAGALGFSAEDCATAIGLMANSGIKASQAGTALRSIFTRMAKPTDESAAAMQKLGVSLTNSDGSMKSLNEVMGQLRTGFNGLSDAEKASTAAALAGQEGMSGLLAIVNASDEDFNKLQESIYGCDGAAAQMAETMQDNLQGQITILKSGLEGLGISLYEGMQEPLKNVVKEAQGMVQELQAAFDEGGLSGMVEAVGNVMAQIVQKVMEAAPQLVETAKNLCSNFISSIMEHSEEFASSGATLVATIINAIVSLAGEMWTAATVLFTQFLAGIAEQMPNMITTAGDAIVQFMQGIVDNAPLLLESAQTIILALANGFVEYAPQILQIAIDLILILAQGLAEAAINLIPAVIALITQLATTFFENLPTIVGVALQIIMALAQGLLDAIPQLILAIPTIITAMVNGFVQSIPQIIQTGIQLLTSLTQALPEIIQALLTAIPQIITSLVTAFTENIPAIVQAGIDLLIALIQDLPTIISTICEALPQIIEAVCGTFADNVDKIVEAGFQLLVALVKNLPAIILEIVAAIPEIISSIVGAFDDGVSSMVDVGGRLIEGIWDGICGCADWLWGKVSSFCSDLWNNILDFFDINSPSRKARKEVGQMIPPGIGLGMEDSMPDLVEQTEDEMALLADKMQAAVDVETGKISLEKNVSTTFKAEKENGASFESGDTTVEITGETHVHVDLDGKEIGKAATPIVDEKLSRIDEHKKRGG